METTNNVIVLNTQGNKHVPLASGDKLSGSVIQLSTDAGNALALGSDNGLKVVIPAQFPDDQVFTSDNSGDITLTLTPTAPNAQGQVDYTIKAIAKLDPAANNAITTSESGLKVVLPVNTTSVALPATVNDATTPTVFFGSNASALGTPAGFTEMTVSGTVVLVPYYTKP